MEQDRLEFATSTGGVSVVAVHGAAGTGIAISTDAGDVLRQDKPARVEHWSGSHVRVLEAGYHEFESHGGKGICRAVILIDQAKIEFEDTWHLGNGGIDVDRIVTVTGQADGGFGTGLVMAVADATGFPDVSPFAPGMMYGDGAAVSDGAIGSPRAYRDGVRQVRIRSDRLPLPVFSVRTKAGWSAAVLDSRPDGSSILADTDGQADQAVVDARIRLSAVGGVEDGGTFSIGCWFPASEGDQTYPTGRNRLHWRRRYHPITDGATQTYRVSFRVGKDADAVAMRSAVWRWAWAKLSPRPTHQDIEAVRQALVAVLASNVDESDGVTGLPLAAESTTGKAVDTPKLMGFTGRNTDAAIYLLHESRRRPDDPAADKYRKLGAAICDSFARLKMDPPQAEGFSRGKPFVWTYLGRPNLLYLRPMCEGARAMLRCWRIEHDGGREYPAWKKWAVDFGRWLLTQQSQDGSFPRAWVRETGVVGDRSPRSSYNAVTLLTLLTAETGDKAFVDAAVRAANFGWDDTQKDGIFVGGTIDNPNVVDKEAGTISLAAFLSLYEATRDPVWLDRAKVAGDFAGAWIYAWNVPMPVDADPRKLHWKPGVDTVSVQLISTGHSGVDQFMAFDVGSYARLFKYTGDRHYFDVARVLLHNTKNMMALPGRTFDLVGPGWQQEHWCLSTPRGRGGHRLWLPWVAVAHLEGIVDCETFDRTLFKELAASSVG